MSGSDRCSGQGGRRQLQPQRRCPDRRRKILLSLLAVVHGGSTACITKCALSSTKICKAPKEEATTVENAGVTHPQAHADASIQPSTNHDYCSPLLHGSCRSALVTIRSRSPGSNHQPHAQGWRAACCHFIEIIRRDARRCLHNRLIIPELSS